MFFIKLMKRTIPRIHSKEQMEIQLVKCIFLAQPSVILLIFSVSSFTSLFLLVYTFIYSLSIPDVTNARHYMWFFFLQWIKNCIYNNQPLIRCFKTKIYDCIKFWMFIKPFFFLSFFYSAITRFVQENKLITS